MATISFTKVDVVGDKGMDGHIITWPAMTKTTDDVGQPYGIILGADRSIQVDGTLGAGGTVLIEGCNEATPVNWYTLNDPSSTALSITALKVEQVLEITRWIRPKVSAGDVTTSLTVTMLARRPR